MSHLHGQSFEHHKETKNCEKPEDQAHMHNPYSRDKKKTERQSRYVVVCTVCGPLIYMCNALCLNRNGEVRALQCESEFLLGEGQVVVRLDRVVGSAQMLVGRLAEIASVGVLCH
jgi:hypothetical protein